LKVPLESLINIKNQYDFIIHLCTKPELGKHIQWISAIRSKRPTLAIFVMEEVVSFR